MPGVKCLYCGGEMKHYVEKVVGWTETYRHNLRCECGATSPYAYNLINAVKAAEFRPMQNPLELYPNKDVPLREVVDMLPIFIEHRFTGEIVGGLYNMKKDMFLFTDEDGGNWMDNEEQGRSWRAWIAYPTREERDAAPWKECTF